MQWIFLDGSSLSTYWFRKHACGACEYFQLWSSQEIWYKQKFYLITICYLFDLIFTPKITVSDSMLVPSFIKSWSASLVSFWVSILLQVINFERGPVLVRYICFGMLIIVLVIIRWAKGTKGTNKDQPGPTRVKHGSIGTHRGHNWSKRG